MIYQSSDGTYGYTGPSAGSATGFDPKSAPSPDGTTDVGDYHTHGAYSKLGPDGDPVATGNPAQDDYDSDNFSPQDKDVITKDGAGKPNYEGYLGTPSGQTKVFIPSTRRVSNF